MMSNTGLITEGLFARTRNPVRKTFYSTSSRVFLPFHTAPYRITWAKSSYTALFSAYLVHHFCRPLLWQCFTFGPQCSTRISWQRYHHTSHTHHTTPHFLPLQPFFPGSYSNSFFLDRIFKDASLYRHSGWEEYKKRTGILFPKLFR